MKCQLNKSGANYLIHVETVMASRVGPSACLKKSREKLSLTIYHTKMSFDFKIPNGYFNKSK